MSNEQFGEAPENGMAQAQMESGPANLEEAFKSLRKMDGADASDSVEAAGLEQDVVQDAGQRDHMGGSAQPQEIAAAGDAGYDGSVRGDGEAVAGIPGDDQVPGGFADGYQELDDEGLVEAYDSSDYQDIQQKLLGSINQQAAMEATRVFKENGINQVTINDLYQRDDRGRVTFTNPDDPDRPFSNRQEAQQWVDAYNSQVKQEWNKYAVEVRDRYMQDTMPAMRLMQFAPIYDSMDSKAQEIMDQIIEPYQVKDNSGMVIGFSCDLNAAKAQAEKLCSMFGEKPQAQQQIQQAPPSGPALDARTSGSSNPQNDVHEPKNLQDAFKMIKEQKKKGSK